MDEVWEAKYPAPTTRSAGTMASGEAVKTNTPYGQAAVNALMGVAVHPLIRDKQNKLHQLLSILENDDEILLVTDLINRAQWVDQSVAMDCADILAKQIVEGWKLTSSDTCLATLEEDTTSGSSDVAIQYLRTSLHQTATGWKGSNIVSGIGQAATSSCSNIVLVDDFIGTGKKAVDKIQWIRGKESFKHNIFVATFVGQHRSRRSVGLVSSAYFACHWRWKSITDVYFPSISPCHVKTMLEIESRFGNIAPRDSLGRGGVESTYFPLGINAPNNVFPIFWKSRHGINKKFVPLLDRSPK